MVNLRQRLFLIHHDHQVLLLSLILWMKKYVIFAFALCYTMYIVFGYITLLNPHSACLFVNLL